MCSGFMYKLTLLRGDWGLGDSGTVAAFTKKPGGDFALPVLVLELPGRLVISDSRRSSPESSKQWGLRVPLRPASTKPCFVFGIAGRVSVVVSLKFMSHATRAGLQDQNKNYMPQTHYCDYPKTNCHGNERTWSQAENMADGAWEKNSTLLYYFVFILRLYFYSDDAQRYHCSYCGCDITLRLKCAICLDFDLCLEVLGSGIRKFSSTIIYLSHHRTLPAITLLHLK